MNYQISEQKLKEVLLQAYEDGWHGVRELKEQYVEEVVEGLHECLTQNQNDFKKWGDIHISGESHPMKVIICGASLSQ